MSDATLVILLLGAATYVLKAAGPVLLGNRTLPPVVARVVDLLPAALLAALVATSVLPAGGVVLDARVVGVAAAGVVLWRGGGFIPTVVVAAAVTALVRALA